MEATVKLLVKMIMRKILLRRILKTINKNYSNEMIILSSFFNRMERRSKLHSTKWGGSGNIKAKLWQERKMHQIYFLTVIANILPKSVQLSGKTFKKYN